MLRSEKINTITIIIGAILITVVIVTPVATRLLKLIIIAN